MKEIKIWIWIWRKMEYIKVDCVSSFRLEKIGGKKLEKKIGKKIEKYHFSISIMDNSNLISMWRSVHESTFVNIECVWIKNVSIVFKESHLLIIVDQFLTIEIESEWQSLNSFRKLMIMHIDQSLILAKASQMYTSVVIGRFNAHQFAQCIVRCQRRL